MNIMPFRKVIFFFFEKCNNMTIITEGIEQSQVLGKFPGPFWEGRFFCRGPSPFTHATFPKT